MKTYWIKGGRFANEYSLFYTEDKEHFDFARELGLTRISRAEAIALCREELTARGYDALFSGYASTHICPLLHTDDVDFNNYPWARRGWFIEYIGRGKCPD